MTSCGGWGFVLSIEHLIEWNAESFFVYSIFKTGPTRGKKCSPKLPRVYNTGSRVQVTEVDNKDQEQEGKEMRCAGFMKGDGMMMG